MPPHAPRQLRADHGTALIHLDRILAPAQGVLNHAFHLEKITFAHEYRYFPLKPAGRADPGTGASHWQALAAEDGPTRREGGTREGQSAIPCPITPDFPIRRNREVRAFVLPQ